MTHFGDKNVGDSLDIVDKINFLSPTTYCHQKFYSVTHQFSLFTIQNKLQVNQPCDKPWIIVSTWLRTVSTRSMLVTNTRDKDIDDNFVTEPLNWPKSCPFPCHMFTFMLHILCIIYLKIDKEYFEIFKILKIEISVGQVFEFLKNSRFWSKKLVWKKVVQFRFFVELKGE